MNSSVFKLKSKAMSVFDRETEYIMYLLIANKSHKGTIVSVKSVYVFVREEITEWDI